MPIKVMSLVSMCAFFVVFWTMSAQGAVFPQYANQYSDQYLINTPYTLDSISTQLYDFSSTNTMRQSFVLRSEDPGARLVEINHLFLSMYFWPGSGATLKLNLYDGDVNTVSAPIHTQTATFISVEAKTGFVVPDAAKAIAIDSGVVLNLDQTYTFEIEVVNLVELSYGYYKNHYSYNEGQSDQGSEDIWFRIQGTVDTETDSLQVRQPGNQRFVLDKWSEFFPTQLVGLHQKSAVLVTPPTGKTWTYKVDDSNLLQLDVQNQGTEDSLILYGQNEGITRVWILDGVDTVNYLQADVRSRKFVKVSYSYIEYPGESDHQVKYYYDSIANEMERIYDSINVKVELVDNGVLAYEWDFNNDSSSYTAERFETWSPIDSGVIPNQTNYFSNLYSIRQNKDDTYYGGSNGGGSSLGFGLTDVPPRAAYKRVHVFNTSEHISSTLSHELAHNLGMNHYSSQNVMHVPPHDTVNIMKTGRQRDQFFQFQWNIVHHTINGIKARGENYDFRSTSNFTLSYQEVTIGETLTLANQTSEGLTVYYRLLDNKLSALSDHEFQADVLGAAKIEYMVAETDGYINTKDTLDVTVVDITTSIIPPSQVEAPTQPRTLYNAIGQSQGVQERNLMKDRVRFFDK